MKTKALFSGALAIALLVLVLPTPSLAQGPIQCEHDYVVQSGDWLAKIAGRYYDDPLAYPAIVLATHDQARSGGGYARITDPNLIEPGWKLCIPSAEMATSSKAVSVEALKHILTAETDILGVTWQWARFDSGDGSVLNVDDPARYTLTLRADGTYQVVADCNRAGGAYTLDGSSLILQPGPTTLAECQPGSLYIEFLRKLGDVRTYVTDDGKLVLNLWADAGNMVFVPVDGTAGLENTLWELKAYLDEAGTVVNVLPGTEITAEFRAGQVAGSAGCNRYFGSYQLDADNLKLGPLGTTMMACEPDVGGQERLYLAALEKVASYQIVDGLLELVDAGGNTVLTFGKVVHAPLTETTWKLTSYHDGKSALVSVLAGSEVSALFTADGKLGGSAGCNNYTTGYEMDGQNLSFGPVATTRKMCAEPEGIMEQESAYLAALERVTAYRIQGDSLELLDAEGGRVATFDAETG